MLHRFVAILALAVALPGLAAQAMQGACEATFSGSAPMDRFGGTVSAEPFTVQVQDQRADWQVEVQPIKMSTKKKGRDEAMHKMFRIPEFPVISGAAHNIDLAALTAGGDQPVEIPFTLTILGTAKEMTAAVSNVKDDGQQLSFDATFVVSLKDFSLKPPVLMGMIRVRDAVPVTAHFTFTR